MKIREQDIIDTNKIGIYCITNLVNDKKYVGQTKITFIHRWKIHLNKLNKNIHHNTYLQNTFNKYGIDNFEFSILEIVEPLEDKNILNNILNFWERYYISYYNTYKNGYNMTKGGDGSLGFKHTEESKRLISLHHKDVSGKNNPNYGGCFYSENIKKEILLINLNLIIEKEFKSLVDTALFLNVSSSQITHACQRLNKCKNYYIIYKNNFSISTLNKIKYKIYEHKIIKFDNNMNIIKIDNINNLTNNKYERKRIYNSIKKNILYNNNYYMFYNDYYKGDDIKCQVQ